MYNIVCDNLTRGFSNGIPLILIEASQLFRSICSAIYFFLQYVCLRLILFYEGESANFEFLLLAIIGKFSLKPINIFQYKKIRSTMQEKYVM